MNMSEESLEIMIKKDYIDNAGIISVDSDDIMTIRDSCDFIDGCKRICYAKEMKDNLKSGLDELLEMHSGESFSHLAVKLLVNKESEFIIHGLSAISNVAESFSDVEIYWGVAKNYDSQDGKVAICIVCGFKRV